ncbi:6894_t:CDS:2 [Cetraspora pellucida]|uniref:ribonuclease H n=1 Tax=Cetraspora pellucida TaxID=1433469 RepID=A0A9N8VNB2_9GLOM|nr:6894_t:CDS:2 [Cetraspora pellucida]
MPKISSLKYYAVAKGEKTEIFTSWKECKEYVNDIKDKLNVWTDGYCKRNGLSDAIGGIGVFFGDKDFRNLSERLPGEQQTNNYAEIYAAIRALEICDKNENLIINTDSIYVINSHNIKKPKKIFDLVNKFNDLIKKRKGKTYLKHVKGHSNIYENEQTDRLTYLGSKNPDVELILPERKNTIKDYFK